MNKNILAIICGLTLTACVTNDYENAEKPNMNELNNTQSLFYHAMVGSLMEQNSQYNNAINHYESLLKGGYNKEVVSKLLNLYKDKEDHLSYLNLIKNTNEEKIKENHQDVLFVYYIINDKLKKAYDLSIKELNKKNSDNYEEYIEKRTFRYLKIIQEIKLIDISYENKSHNFIEYFKNKNNSVYYTLKSNYNEIINFDEYKNEKLNDDDYVLFLLFEYNYSPSFEIVKELHHAGINVFSFNNLLLNHYSEALVNRDYEEIKKTSVFLRNNVSNDNKINNLFEFLAYYYLFENDNALFKLEQNKENISKNFYYYSKSVLNYRMGYNKAAAKYLEKVDDLKLIADNLNFYFDVDKNRTLLKSKTSDLEYMNHELLFLMNQNDLKNANILSVKVLNYMKENNVTSKVLELNLNYLEFLNDEDRGLEEARKKYEENKNIDTANFYAYLIALSNKNIDEGLRILSEFENDEKYKGFIDTHAWLLYKNGKFQDAINLYEEENLSNSQSYVEQEHMSKIYLKLGNMKKYKEHKDKSKQLFNK